MSEIRSQGLQNFDIRIFDSPTEDILNLLSKTFLGTPGGLQYQLVNTQERIREYKEIYFATLYKSNHLLGMLALCPRHFVVGQDSVPAYYIRYLAIASPFQSKTDVRRKKQRIIREKFDQSVKEQIMALFRNPSQLGIPGFSEEGASLFYAFIEKQNIRSVNLVEQAGYQSMGNFFTFPFSRRNPKALQGVRKSNEQDREYLISQLTMCWQQTNGWFSDFVFLHNNYFVLEEEGCIVAGVQAHPASFRLRHMPGLKGFLLLNIFSRLPYFSSILKDLELRFLAFEGLYCKPGHEKKIPALLESCCAKLGYHAGLCWLDERSALFPHLKNSRNMGLLNTLTGQEPISVYVNFQHMNQAMQEQIRERPFYISAFDSI